MDARVKFVIVLRPGSLTETLFHDNYDALDGDLRALYCTEMELSGYHARIVRIPAPKSRAALQGAVRQNFWFPASDIALAFEYDATNPSVGFG